MLQLLLSALCLVVFFVAYKIFSLARNIVLARKTGLPYVIRPVHELERWAYYTTRWGRKKYHDWLLEEKGWPSFFRFLIKDWMFEDKYRAHQELGDAFLVVSLGGLVCYTADPTMISDICSRRRDFVKHTPKLKLIEPYGPNVVSAEGDVWRRHNRVVAPALGPAIYPPVWDESHVQTDIVLKRWATRGYSTLKNDVYDVALNVMCSANFGRQYQEKGTSNHNLSVSEAIEDVSFYLRHLFLYPLWLLPYIGARKGYEAYHEFDQYNIDFIRDEKDKDNVGVKQRGLVKGKETVLGAMIRMNEMDTESSGVASRKRDDSPLTQQELTGNIFLLTRAGYETTANSLIYSTIMLVVYPNIQREARTEVDRIYEEAAAEGRLELCYEDDFPKFRYLLGLMFETLRAYPIVPPITRMTHKEQSVSVGATHHTVSGAKAPSHVVLPANCGVIGSAPGVHNNPSVWPNPQVFEPKRWLVKEPHKYDPLDQASSELPKVDATPSVNSAKKGTFMTWGEGARACPGKKFAQSEWTSFTSYMLRHYILELDSSQDRTFIEKSVRCRTAGGVISLSPPEDVQIRLVPRNHA